MKGRHLLAGQLPLLLAGCATPPRGDLPLPWRALGTEPFWSLTLDAGTMRWQPLEGTPRTEPLPPARRDGPARVYQGRDMRLSIIAGPCSDGMSDRVYPARVQVMVAGQIYSGCGAPLASPVQGKAGR